VGDHKLQKGGKVMTIKDKVTQELESVREEIAELDLHDELIPPLCGWEKALVWVLRELEGESNE
jgi:hypothetical protein